MYHPSMGMVTISIFIVIPVASYEAASQTERDVEAIPSFGHCARLDSMLRYLHCPLSCSSLICYYLRISHSRLQIDT